jgi:hypothetical protein
LLIDDRKQNADSFFSSDRESDRIETNNHQPRLTWKRRFLLRKSVCCRCCLFVDDANAAICYCMHTWFRQQKINKTLVARRERSRCANLGSQKVESFFFASNFFAVHSSAYTQQKLRLRR